MGDEGGRERRKEAKLTGRKEKLGAIHAADTLVGYDATWRCWKSLPGIPGIRKKILGNEIACRGFHEIPPRRRSNMRPNKEGRVDAFLIFIRMRDTPAGSPVPETRSPERKASPPLFSLCILFPPPTRRTSIIPASISIFPAKEEDKGWRVVTWRNSRQSFTPSLSMGKGKTRRGRERFDDHSTRASIRPSMFIRTSFLSRILCIPLARRRGEEEEEEGANLFEKRGGNWRNLETLGKFGRRASSMENLGNRRARDGERQPSVSSKLLPPEFSKPWARARAHERERAHAAPGTA